MTEVYVNGTIGSDQAAGTHMDPVKTPGVGLKKLSGGKDCLHLQGTFHEGLNVSKMKFTDKLVVDGHGMTLFYGFEGIPEDFDVFNLPKRTWGNVTAMDVHNVEFRDIEIWGGASQCFSIDDSYPKFGIRNLTLDGISCRYGAPRGIFMGGHNIDGVTIRNTDVRETCYGDTTHGLYLSGGQWDPAYPPIRNVTIDTVLSTYSGGRHGMQMNGRFDGVKIKHFNASHNQLGGLSLIGVRNAVVEKCALWGNHRGIVLYDYFDYGYFDPENPEFFKATHHAMENILIKECTIVVGPTQWMKDAYHNNTPANQAAIFVNSNLGAMYPDEFRPQAINIFDNVLWTVGDTVAQFSHNYDALATTMGKNMMWAQTGNPSVKIVGHSFHVSALNQTTTQHFKQNIPADPQFKELPVYPTIDLTEAPYAYDFSQFPTSANLNSKNAASLGLGAFPHKKVTIVKGKPDVKPTGVEGKEADPPEEAGGVRDTGE